MVETALERHGRLDILILNAGTQAMNPIADYSEEDWDRLMDLMVKGPFLAMKFAWPYLTRQPGGRIIELQTGCWWRRRSRVRVLPFLPMVSDRIGESAC